MGFMLELKLIETKIVVVSRTEKQSILIVGPNLIKFINKEIKKPIVCLPNRLPMIVKPKPYSKDSLGGYLLNDIEYTDPLILENKEFVEETKILNDNVIFDMVNKVSCVAFTINKEVLDFILKNYTKYDLLIDPLSLNEKLKIRERKELESFNSKRDLEQNILGLAIAYQHLDVFYFPVRLDYRGRLNCVTQYLTYQGSELSKALLLFAKGDKVDLNNNLAINYLKIYGANCFGLDKLSNKMSK
jgi:DNA-directed RNA polymerase